MPEMKNSGIQWVADIPVHWEIKPLYCLFGERKSKNSLGEEQNLLSLSYGRIIRKDINTNGGLLPASFNTYNIIEPGDIIIRPTDLQNDKRSLRTGYSTEHGIITSAYIALKPISDVNCKYMHYLLHAYDVMKVFYNMGNGVRQGLNFDEFKRLNVCIPPISEQDTIVNFLDEKCENIDSLTADIQSQIETLEEYKKSVITEVVTKGLNPNVEMKDSGVEWIGEIPKHFVRKRIKYCISGMADGTHGTFQRVQDGKMLLSAKNVFEDGLHISETESLISESDYNFIIKNGFPKKDDVLLCCVGTVGRCMLYKEDYSIAFQRSIIFLRPSNRIITPKMLFYCLQTEYTLVQEKMSVTKSAQEGLYQGAVSELYVIFPESIDEQKIITDYLDTKCSEIDAIISEKKEQLSTLAEYKKSLIYEYVTGKKEVVTA